MTSCKLVIIGNLQWLVLCKHNMDVHCSMGHFWQCHKSLKAHGQCSEVLLIMGMVGELRMGLVDHLITVLTQYSG